MGEFLSSLGLASQDPWLQTGGKDWLADLGLWID